MQQIKNTLHAYNSIDRDIFAINTSNEKHKLFFSFYFDSITFRNDGNHQMKFTGKFIY